MRRYIKLCIPLLGIVSLILPLFHMNTSEITEQENRTLAKLPEIKKQEKPNYEFGKEFESWLEDRFWCRDQLIDARFQTMYKINGRIENDKAFVGDDGWMFKKDAIVNVPSLEKQREKIEKDADILKRFDDKFKGKNVPIYLVLIPDRNQLYQKYWEKYYTPKPRLDYGDELIKALKDHPNIRIIYPKEEFIEAMKAEDVYCKADPHLNRYGAQLLLDSTFKKFRDDFDIDKNIRYITKNYTLSPDFIANTLKIDGKTENWFSMNVEYETIKKCYRKQLQIGTKKIWEQFSEYYSEDFLLHKTLHIFAICYGIDGGRSLLAPLFQKSYIYRVNYLEDIQVTVKNFQKYFKKTDQNVIMLYQTDNLFKILTEINEVI